MTIASECHNANFTTYGRCFNGVDNDVHECLLQQIAIAARKRATRRIIIEKQRHAPVHCIRTYEFHNTASQVRKIDYITNNFQRLREIEKGSYNSVQALNLIRYDSYLTFRLGIPFDNRFQQGKPGCYRIQWILDLVRYAACKAIDSL
jgi:hypothetical protein